MTINVLRLFQRKQLLFSSDRQSFKQKPEDALQLKWTIKRIKDYLPQSICLIVRELLFQTYVPELPANLVKQITPTTFSP